MNRLAALLARHSTPVRYLGGPGPTPEQIDAALAAAACAPDHGQLCPWRFRLVRGDALARFAEVLVTCALRRDPASSPEQLAKLRLPASRAPLAIIVSCEVRVHKVPQIEQILSTAAATMNLLNAFDELGFGAIWLTGASVYDAAVPGALGLGAEEKLLGFLYVGSRTELAPPVPQRPARERYARDWEG